MAYDLPPTSYASTKLHPLITKLDTRQLKRITKLRNKAKRMLPNPKTTKSFISDPQHTTQTQTHASEVLRLTDPPNLDDIPALCNKAIATIINKANHKVIEVIKS